MLYLSNHNGSSTKLDETLSLQSDIGDSRERYKLKTKGTISFFGFNLFGKRPPIHLPTTTTTTTTRSFATVLYEHHTPHHHHIYLTRTLLRYIPLL